MHCITSDASEGPTHKRARTESIPPHDHDTEDDANAAAAFNSQPPLFYPKASPLRLISESTRSFVYSLGRSGTSWLHRDAPPDLLSIGKSAAGKEGTTSALAVKWSVKLAKCVDASPLVIFSTDAPPTPDSAIAPHSYQQPYQHQQPNQQVIIGSHDGDVISVDGATGDVLWTLQLGEHIEASAVPNPAGDVFFLGSYSGQDVDGFRSHRPVQQQQKRMSTEEGGEEVAPALGCLWAIRSATGEVLWHFCTAGEIKASVLVLDQCLFLGAYDGYLYQLNAADGTLIAKLHCGGSIYASPVASKDGTNFVVCTTSGVISQFSFPGGLAAITPLQSLQSVPVFSTPLAVGAAFITAGTDGSLTCREFSGAEITAVVEEEEEEEKENVLWSAVPSHTAIFSSACIIPVPASAGSTAQEAAAIIGCHDGKLRKFSVRDGAVMWECNVGVAIFASPCMASATECVFATAAGDVLVVEVETGVIRAKLRLPAEVFSSPVCVDNCIYIGCRDDRLYCLERINL